MTVTFAQSQIRSVGDKYRDCNRKIDHLIDQIQMIDAWENIDKFRELNEKLESAVIDAEMALEAWNEIIFDVINPPKLTYQFSVELASDNFEVDAEGNEIPTDFKIIEVELTEEMTIATVLEDRGELDGWGIVSHWEREECLDCF